jgi:anti-sigma B factor antagonist
VTLVPASQGRIMGLTLCVRPGDDGIIVTVSGEVDVGTEGLLRPALLRIIRERGARLLLDVSGVSFMDCAGLRALLATRRNAELRGGCMRLIAVSRAVRRIMELTGAREALAELARRIQRPVTAEDYQVAVFEREAPLRSGEAVRLTRLQVKPPGVADVAEVFGDTAVPRLAEVPGFCATLLFAAPASGQLISQTVWRDPSARAASPGVAEMIRAEVLDDEDCEIRAVEDYRLVFSSARKPSVPSS